MKRARNHPGRQAWHAALLACATLLLARGTASAAPALSEQEQRDRILYEAREDQLELRAYLYGDAALDAYLQQVLDRLFPGDPQPMRAMAIRSFDFNAHSDATGAVYVNIGALMRLRNEAELAALLAHEGAHVHGDHFYRGRLQEKSASRTAVIVGSLFNSPQLAYNLRHSSTAGFSRTLEAEADRVGVERLQAAGYPAQAAADIMGRLAHELAALHIKEQGFYSDHPRTLERVRALTALAQGGAPGEPRRAEFLAATQPARAAALAATVELKDGALIVELLSDDAERATFAPEGEYLLGEGYRLRATVGDEQRALDQYNHSIESVPGVAQAWWARARLLLKRGERAQALADFQHFVAEAPDSREARFAMQAISQLQQGGTP